MKLDLGQFREKVNVGELVREEPWEGRHTA